MATPDANVENTLLAASAERLERDDRRVLAVLVTWFKVHHAWVNADRLYRAVLTYCSRREPLRSVHYGAYPLRRGRAPRHSRLSGNGRRAAHRPGRWVHHQQ